MTSAGLQMGSHRPPVDLYVGEVMHHRMRPFRHRFVYRVFYLLLDVDRLDEAANRWFGIERFNLWSFRARDHGARDGTPLRPWIEGQLGAHGHPGKPHRIRLLCLPRVLGYVFNPLSVYFCYGEDGGLQTIVYEVKNTFGGQHTYVLGADDPAETVRHDCAKRFYVSPFIEREALYRFRIKPPAEDVVIAINERVAEGPQLIATVTGKRQPFTESAVLRLSLAMPFLTLKVIAAIHWQALKLWLKGATFHSVPRADQFVTAEPDPQRIERVPSNLPPRQAQT
ncbi:MAG: DUF1365 domain-containing protein [Geminicoccaceae bacterium]